MKKVFLSYIKHLSLVDWILILTMLLLMVQIIFNLFFHEMKGNSNAIDGVIRTTAVSIFGYFMGNGFVRGENKKNYKLEFYDGNSDQIMEKYLDIDDLGIKRRRYNIQIVIVGAIGIISLLTLIIVRNINIMTVDKIATLSQLRDFVSASTGFLISNSKNK